MLTSHPDSAPHIDVLSNVPPLKNTDYTIQVDQQHATVKLIDVKDARRVIQFHKGSILRALERVHDDVITSFDEDTVILHAHDTQGMVKTFEISVSRVLNLYGAIGNTGDREKIESERKKKLAELEELTAPAKTEYKTKVEELRETSFELLDLLARFFLDPKNGQITSYILQAGLGLIGIPFFWSVGDILGILRGYLNVREGNIVKGAAQIITAAIPALPTPVAHAAIDMYAPTIYKGKAPTRFSVTDLFRATTRALQGRRSPSGSQRSGGLTTQPK